jgi:hypothetical protein
MVESSTKKYLFYVREASMQHVSAEMGYRPYIIQKLLIVQQSFLVLPGIMH